MNKDVIYIDTEDDITAIIGKIKSSKEKIVALVPPKRIGVLQSAVNLRLLSRTANNANKHLVLITSNRALIALSAASMIPVAKNLQSKPEIAETEESEIDDNEDVIDGADMPVGELATTVDSPADDGVSDAIDTISIDEKSSTNEKVKFKKSGKVPDFSSFRKKIFIIGAAVVVLTVFLVWAIVSAPAARVIITTKTSPAPVSATLKLGTIEATDAKKGIIQTVSKQIKKDVSVEFVPTGKKDLGNKAKGTMEITRAAVSPNSLLVPAGTTFTNTGCTFTSDAAVTLAKTELGEGFFVHDSAVLNVTSVDAGEGCNFSARAYQSGLAGITAAGSAMAGGTTKMAIVATTEDILKASQTLVDLSSEDVKNQLTQQFTNSEIVIRDSFNVEHAAAVSVPAVDTEVTTAKVKLTSATTFTILAIAKSEMQIYLADVLAKQVGNNQRVFSDGIDGIKMSGYLKNETGQTVNVSTVGQIGPNIDANSVKEQVKGKRYGDVQSILGTIQGVSNVDVKFPYFWINTVPNEVNKIDVEFVLENA
ncbi:MAG: hypothetical protein WCP11_02630 [Candidatus Saccharibacteria bacterium]